ncbi:MAG: hypothetical protein PHC97_04430 [Patescibacteria group bacterium]|nr:hypothetical protein [Patescibacteria group bacterium]
MLKSWKNRDKSPRKKNHPTWLKMLLWVLLFVLIASAITCLVLQKTDYVAVLKTAWQMHQQQIIPREDKEILAKLGEIMLLPEGTPTMALITDAAALKKQQPLFFANAKNGDRLIIYSDKAIIYDAEANKIIQVGPVQFSAFQSLNFAIYNGTGVAKAESDFELKLATVAQNAQIKVRQSAAKTDYENTLVIDVTGKNQAAVANLATALNAQVSGLPISEKAPPGVDILIIIGKNG